MLTRTMNPFATLNELQSEMNRLFEGYGSRLDGGSWPRPRTFPALNVWEDGEVLRAETELPGVRNEDIEVYAVGNELTIKGNRRSREGENLSYHRRERGTGEFTRILALPTDIEAEKVEASLKDGVLTITLPKAEAAKPRRIEVKA